MTDQPTVVHVVRLDSKHGDETHVFFDIDAARADAASFMDEWWEHEMNDTERPADDAEALSLFGEHTQQTWITIETLEVQ